MRGDGLLRSSPMEAILAFGAALVALRLAGMLAARWRQRRQPQFALWSAGLATYALGAAAIAWGAAAGWNDGVFRAYYLFGGLLTAALLGAGSLAGAGVRAAIPVVLVYAGLAAGVALAVPLEAPLAGTSIPEAQEYLALFPARILAILGNGAGSIALVWVAVAGFRRRPLGNALLLAGFTLAAAGSAVAGLGAAQTAAFVRGCSLSLVRGLSCAHADNSYLLQTTRLLA